MLEKLQIRLGERIALISENCPEFIRAIIEIWQAKAIAVPVNPLFPPAKLAGAIKEVTCHRAIFGSNRSGSCISGALSNYFKGKVYSFEEFKKSDIAIKKSFLRYDGPFSFLNIRAGALKHSELLNNPATIIFTTGSTSKPRAVMHTIANHYYNALGSNENIILSSQDIWLLSLPLYHVSGLSLIMKSYLSEASIAAPDLQYRHMPLSEMIEKSFATHISLVPVQLHRMMQDDDTVKLLRKLKAILVGGGTMPDELTKQCLQNGLKIFKSYGLSEMASQVTTTSPADTGRHMFSSGKLLKYRELTTAPDMEILVKGKTLFSGYIGTEKKGPTNNKDRDAGVFLPLDDKGWFHTGDTGYIDNEGYLHVIGRKDMMFVSKGENIYPEEIENVILGFPGIENAVVVPVNCPETGNVPAVFIKPSEKSGDKFNDISGLKKYLEKNIEKIKIPRYYLEWPKQINRQLKPGREKLKALALKLIDSKAFQE